MTTTATIELTEREIAHRDACSALKALIKDLSSNQLADKTAHKVALRERRWYNTRDSAIKRGKGDITTLHIIHNRIRHDKPHMGSPEVDAEWISTCNVEKFLSRHLAEKEVAAVMEVF